MWKISIKYSKSETGKLQLQILTKNATSYFIYRPLHKKLQLFNIECHSFIKFWNLIGGKHTGAIIQGLSRTAWVDKKRIVPEYSPHIYNSGQPSHFSGPLPHQVHSNWKSTAPEIQN